MTIPLSRATESGETVPVLHRSGVGCTDDFTVGRIVLRRSAFGWWSGKASIRNERAWSLNRTRGRAQGWANRLMSETNTRTWAGMSSHNIETMSLCDQEAVR